MWKTWLVPHWASLLSSELDPQDGLRVAPPGIPQGRFQGAEISPHRDLEDAIKAGSRNEGSHGFRCALEQGLSPPP